MMNAEVRLWGNHIGAVRWDDGNELAQFEYSQEFIGSGIQVAPRMMPLNNAIYSFPDLSRATFRGLPGMLADSLPDKFGNALVDAWLASQGRDTKDFNAVERLCYTGSRGMGALEYSPSVGPFDKASKSVEVEIGALVELANKALAMVEGLDGSFEPELREDTLLDILRVGTSAGGARAKALIAYNEETGEVRSGQVKADRGFSSWLLKFDGVKDSDGNRLLGDPKGYGLIEYAYYRMARAAGLNMMESMVLDEKESDRRHFMTRRFDRTETGQKLHMQSLAAIQHYDYNMRSGSYSHEQALRTIKELDMPMADIEEQFRRMAFNVVSRNQDDHVKNIAFLMDRAGTWTLSPAYDMTYSYGGSRTKTHQMSINGKLEGFTIGDFMACAKTVSMKRGRAEEIVGEVREAVLDWRDFADEAGVVPKRIDMIAKTHRTDILEKSPSQGLG